MISATLSPSPSLPAPVEPSLPHIEFAYPAMPLWLVSVSLALAGNWVLFAAVAVAVVAVAAVAVAAVAAVPLAMDAMPAVAGAGPVSYQDIERLAAEAGPFKHQAHNEALKAFRETLYDAGPGSHIDLPLFQSSVLVREIVHLQAENYRLGDRQVSWSWQAMVMAMPPDKRAAVAAAGGGVSSVSVVSRRGSTITTPMPPIGTVGRCVVTPRWWTS